MPAFLSSATRDGAFSARRNDRRGRDVDRVATGPRLSKAYPGFVCTSRLTTQRHAVPGEILACCEESRATLAAGIAAGIY